VQLKPTPGGLSLVIRATGPVSMTQFKLSEPDRLVFDIVDAVWADDVQTPKSAPHVTAIRTGQFQDTIARLVFELADPKLVCIQITSGPTRTLKAQVGQGREVASLSGDKLQAILRRRDPRLASRGDLLGGVRSVLPIKLLPIPPARGNLKGKFICVDPGHGGKSSGRWVATARRRRTSAWPWACSCAAPSSRPAPAC